MKFQRTLLATATSTLLFGLPAAAQNNQQTAIEEVQTGIEETPVAIEETIVTADFRDINLQNMPASVSVITSEAIAARSAQHVEQLLALAPNVNFSAGSSRSRYIQIRGIGERSQFASPINPSVGTIIDEVDFSGIGTGSTLFDIERVEILRGPQSTRYGANALAGIIAMSSTAPSKDNNGYIETTLADYDTWSVGAAAGGALSDTVLYRASIQQYKSDGYIENAYLNKDDTNNFDEFTARAKLRWLVSDDLTIDTTLFKVDVDNGYDAFSLDNTRTTLSDEPGVDKQDTNAFSIKSVWQASDAVNVEFIGSYADSELAYGYDEDWGFVGICDGIQCTSADEYSSTDTYTRDRDTTTLEARALSSEAGKLFNNTTTWLAGIYYREQSVDLQRDYFDFDLWQDAQLFSQYDTENLAAFAETTSSLSDNLQLTIGLRVEDWQADYADSLAVDVDNDETLYGGKAVIDYTVDDAHLVYASVARGYKAGGVNTDGTLNPNEREFDTEYQWAYEAGIKSDWLDNSLQTRLAVFYNDRDDIQVKDSIAPVGGPGAFVDYITNAAEGSNYGVELESVWQASEALQLFANLGLLRAEIDSCDVGGCAGLEERDQPHAPHYQYAVGGKYSLESGFFIQVDIEGKDEFYYSSSHDAQSDSYDLVNAKVGYDTTDWSLSLWARNVTDEDYTTRGFQFGNDPRNGYATTTYTQLGEPRLMGVTGRFKF